MCDVHGWGLLLAIALAAAAMGPISAPAQQKTLPNKVEQCAPCHGPDGNSHIENIPSLAGQPAFFTLNQLILMREGVRPIEVMAPIVKDLDDQDISALADHYAKLPPRRSGEPVDRALARRGAELSRKLHCESCHLPSLAGQMQMPRIAGQRIDYLIKALKEFRDNKRRGADTLMSAAVFGVSDVDIAALAHYAASR
jgi:cytochrome c553